MIAFPAFAALIALICAAVVGRDALRRPKPERLTWAIAFLVFAIAAGAEVAGDAVGWSPALARLYYLTGAVLVVGILALGEVFLLFPGRVPALLPGLALLVAALATTAVWSAPVDASLLASEGWAALERGPLLVALAASINAGGTAVLAGGTLYSAWKLRGGGMRHRALGCLLIALGTIVVALGGTLTRFGHREFLYLAMAVGIAVIFAGYCFTRGPVARPTGFVGGELEPRVTAGKAGPWLVPLPKNGRAGDGGLIAEAVHYVVEHLLPLDDEALAAACRRWSATAVTGDTFTREQARQVWSLRRTLPEAMRPRFDALPASTQAQLAELFDEVWAAQPALAAGDRGA
jgi:hypothetical protein